MSIRCPLDTHSRHFTAKLKRKNLWFRGRPLNGDPGDVFQADAVGRFNDNVAYQVDEVGAVNKVNKISEVDDVDGVDEVNKCNKFGKLGEANGITTRLRLHLSTRSPGQRGQWGRCCRRERPG